MRHDSSPKNAKPLARTSRCLLPVLHAEYPIAGACQKGKACMYGSLVGVCKVATLVDVDVTPGGTTIWLSVSGVTKEKAAWAVGCGPCLGWCHTIRQTKKGIKNETLGDLEINS